jgi:hypothetical protein
MDSWAFGDLSRTPDRQIAHRCVGAGGAFGSRKSFAVVTFFYLSRSFALGRQLTELQIVNDLSLCAREHKV